MKKFFQNLVSKVKGVFTPSVEVSYTDISMIKSVVKNTVGIIAEVKKAKADDDKISKGEYLLIGRSALPLFNDIRKWKVLKAQIIDFKSEEGIELAEYCVTLGILPGDVTKVIAHAIALVEGSVGLYKDHVLPIVAAVKNMRKK